MSLMDFFLITFPVACKSTLLQMEHIWHLRWLFKTDFVPGISLATETCLNLTQHNFLDTFLFPLAFLLSARHSVMFGSTGPDLCRGTEKTAIYFNLPRDRRSHDQLMWLHPCTVSLQWCCRAALPAFGFEGWLLFSSHYTAPEMHPGGWVRGMEVGWVGVG